MQLFSPRVGGARQRPLKQGPGLESSGPLDRHRTRERVHTHCMKIWGLAVSWLGTSPGARVGAATSPPDCCARCAPAASLSSCLLAVSCVQSASFFHSSRLRLPPSSVSPLLGAIAAAQIHCIDQFSFACNGTRARTDRHVYKYTTIRG
jgi:hypothetical protein